MRHQSWVLKIDYDNGAGAGDILWHLGYQGDFALTKGVSDDDPSVWFSFQHFPSIVSQSGTGTTLAVWDNGDSRVLDTSGDICPSVVLNTPCYSRATIFQLDESAMVADLFWETLPGAEGYSLGEGVSINSTMEILSLILCPQPTAKPDLASQVEEVTQTPTPQVVWQLAVYPVTLNAYRAYRVPSLYPGVNWQY